MIRGTYRTVDQKNRVYTDLYGSQKGYRGMKEVLFNGTLEEEARVGKLTAMEANNLLLHGNNRSGGNITLFAFRDFDKEKQVKDFIVMKMTDWSESPSPRPTLDGLKMRDLLPNETYDVFHQEMVNVLETGVPFIARGVPHSCFVNVGDNILYLDVVITRSQNLLSCTWMDVTDMMTAEQNLSSIVESITDPHVLLTPVLHPSGLVEDFVYTEVNAAACEEYGLIKDDLVGKTVKEVQEGRVVHKFFHSIANVYMTDIPFIRDGLLVEFEGENNSEVFFYDVRCLRVNHAVNITWRDVTDKYTLVNEMRKEQKRLEATLESLIDAHVILFPVKDESGETVDFTIANANDAAATFFNCDKQKLLEKSILTLFPTVVGTGMFDMYVETLKSGTSVLLDSWLSPKSGDGEKTFYEIRIAEFDGYVYQTWRDITEKVQREKELSEAEENYRLLVDNAADVIMLIEMDDIKWVSSAVTKQFGGKPEEWLGKRFIDFLHPKDFEKYQNSKKNSINR